MKIKLWILLIILKTISVTLHVITLGIPKLTIIITNKIKDIDKKLNIIDEGK